jgi:hypothetical protein
MSNLRLVSWSLAEGCAVLLFLQEGVMYQSLGSLHCQQESVDPMSASLAVLRSEIPVLVQLLLMLNALCN